MPQIPTELQADLYVEVVGGGNVRFRVAPDGASPTGVSLPTSDETSRTLLSEILAALGPVGGLVPVAYDELALSYTGDDLTTVVYKNGGVTVATLTLGYSGGNLVSVVRS